MEKKKTLIIPFVGLKEGSHQFNFKIDTSFFEQFEYSIIKQGAFNVALNFLKKKNMFELDFEIEGEIIDHCDRCNLLMSTPVFSEEKLIIKFGKEHYTETDDVKVISENDHELDLTNILYELISLTRPIKIKHENISDCDQEVIAKLNKLSQQNENKEGDPRWAALSKLKDKNE